MALTPTKEEETPALNRRTFIGLEVLTLCGLHVAAIASGLLQRRPLSISSFYASNVVVQILADASYFTLYLFIVYSSGDKLAEFGLLKLKGKDLLAFLVAGALMALLSFGNNLFHPSHYSFGEEYASRLAPVWLLVPLFLAVGAAEEFMFRGYLIPRLEELSHSKWIALFSQAVIFASVHSYQG